VKLQYCCASRSCNVSRYAVTTNAYLGGICALWCDGSQLPVPPHCWWRHLLSKAAIYALSRSVKGLATAYRSIYCNQMKSPLHRTYATTFKVYRNKSAHLILLSAFLVRASAFENCFCFSRQTFAAKQTYMFYFVLQLLPAEKTLTELTNEIQQVHFPDGTRDRPAASCRDLALISEKTNRKYVNGECVCFGSGLAGSSQHSKLVTIFYLLWPIRCVLDWSQRRRRVRRSKSRLSLLGRRRSGNLLSGFGPSRFATSSCRARRLRPIAARRRNHGVANSLPATGQQGGGARGLYELRRLEPAIDRKYLARARLVRTQSSVWTVFVWREDTNFRGRAQSDEKNENLSHEPLWIMSGACAWSGVSYVMTVSVFGFEWCCSRCVFWNLKFYWNLKWRTISVPSEKIYTEQIFVLVRM